MVIHDNEKKRTLNDTDATAKAAAQALQQGIAEGVTLKEVMKLYTAYVYELKERNKVHTAKALNVNRRSLQRWGVGKDA